MTKEEVLNTIIEHYKNGSTSALSDYCDRARCADCPFNTEDCIDDVVMAILDRLIKAEEHQETNLEHYILDKRVNVIIRNEDEVWHLIFKVGTDDACYESRNRWNAIEWLLSPYEPPKYKLSKLEYDLLDYCCYKGCDDTFKDWTVLMDMQNNGHYKGIPKETKIRDILDNAEVIEE